jgi:hypothetical protein
MQNLHRTFSSGVIPERTANADRNSNESTSLFCKEGPNWDERWTHEANGAWADNVTHLIIIEEPENGVCVEIELPLRDAQVLHESRLHDFLELFDGESKPLRNVVECLPEIVDATPWYCT